MGGIGSLFRSLFEDLGIPIRPEILLVLFLASLLLFVPMMQKNAHTDKARKLLKSLPDKSTAERTKIQEEVLRIVWDSPDGLVAIASEALRLGLTSFARQVVDRLRETGQKTDDLRVFQRTLEGDAPVMPEQVLVQVEAMLESGMVDAARKRLAPALVRWPDHPELLALDARLRQDAEPQTEPVA